MRVLTSLTRSILAAQSIGERASPSSGESGRWGQSPETSNRPSSPPSPPPPFSLPCSSDVRAAQLAPGFGFAFDVITTTPIRIGSGWVDDDAGGGEEEDEALSLPDKASSAEG